MGSQAAWNSLDNSSGSGWRLLAPGERRRLNIVILYLAPGFSWQSTPSFKPEYFNCPPPRSIQISPRFFQNFSTTKMELTASLISFPDMMIPQEPPFWIFSRHEGSNQISPCFLKTANSKKVVSQGAHQRHLSGVFLLSATY